ncbi:DUF2066 domain-containing protein [Pseudomonas songnenensis]|jgi:hypothetical protein|uniref:DUF2066 domain-containing protein n=1 Tax=Pseudomonas songnenensis TaxID=1176259 RepID=A0ABX9UX38_9PSED|nr:DUF2066 domain-containing protein [Pseudomonas songnenensis]MCQ4300884.1 DUF2066 domain-containing protein [Pseudomonas songnenensis]RMH97968.1 DUF2066 domain-containing protein [Pseudomonas songnenensis]
MRVIYRLIVLCVALGAALPSQAEQLRGLYQVREPVSGQQAEERAAALQRAFDTLLLRLTGDAQVAKRQEVAALRDDPQQLISKYGYEGEHIVVDFDPGTTERSLRRAGVSLWGSNRPTLLVWWLNERVEGTQLLGDGQDGAAPLRSAAQHRGLPVRLPLADLSEQLLATPDAFGANSRQTLGDASERYDADVLLAVHAREADSAWQGVWKVWLDDEERDGKAKADSLEGLADAVLLAVSQYLAPRYVVAPGAASDLTVEIIGADVARFAELDRLLEPFGGSLLRVESDRLVYRVNASPEQLRAQLSLARLHEVPEDELPLDASQPMVEPGDEAAAPAAPQGGTVLRFRW